MRLLAIDLGTKCGWSVWIDGEFVEAGCWSLKNKSTEKVPDPIRRARLYSLLNGKVNQFNINVTAVEQVNPATMRGNRQRELHYGDRAILEMISGRGGIPLHYQPVGTVKKHFTGMGNAKKPEMMAACAAYGYDCDGDDNTADAIAVGMLTVNQLKMEAQREVEKVEPKTRPAAGRARPQRQRRKTAVGDRVAS